MGCSIRSNTVIDRWMCAGKLKLIYSRESKKDPHNAVSYKLQFFWKMLVFKFAKFNFGLLHENSKLKLPFDGFFINTTIEYDTNRLQSQYSQ
jgi:hypothetical protein